MTDPLRSPVHYLANPPLLHDHDDNNDTKIGTGLVDLLERMKQQRQQQQPQQPQKEEDAEGVVRTSKSKNVDDDYKKKSSTTATKEPTATSKLTTNFDVGRDNYNNNNSSDKNAAAAASDISVENRCRQCCRGDCQNNTANHGQPGSITVPPCMLLLPDYDNNNNNNHHHHENSSVLAGKRQLLQDQQQQQQNVVSRPNKRQRIWIQGPSKSGKSCIGMNFAYSKAAAAAAKGRQNGCCQCKNSTSSCVVFFRPYVPSNDPDDSNINDVIQKKRNMSHNNKTVYNYSGGGGGGGISNPYKAVSKTPSSLAFSCHSRDDFFPLFCEQDVTQLNTTTDPRRMVRTTTTTDHHLHRHHHYCWDATILQRIQIVRVQNVQELQTKLLLLLSSSPSSSRSSVGMERRDNDCHDDHPCCCCCCCGSGSKSSYSAIVIDDLDKIINGGSTTTSVAAAATTTTATANSMDFGMKQMMIVNTAIDTVQRISDCSLLISNTASTNWVSNLMDTLVTLQERPPLLPPPPHLNSAGLNPANTHNNNPTHNSTNQNSCRWDASIVSLEDEVTTSAGGGGRQGQEWINLSFRFESTIQYELVPDHKASSGRRYDGTTRIVWSRS